MVTDVWRLAALPVLVPAVAVLLLAGLARPASPAEAHAGYERSEPADGAVLAESPGRIDVYFSQEVRRSGGLPTLIVVNAAGDVLEVEAVLDDDDRTHMFVELPPELPEGRYTVIWHTLSDEDGEEAQGAFFFTVGESAATPAVTGSPAAQTATPGATVSPAATPAAAGGDDDGVPLAIAALAVVGAAVAAAGAGLAAGRALGG